MAKPSKPLMPVFVNQRARIEEHDRFMAEARQQYPDRPICPDCFRPPQRCIHWRPKWK